MNLQQRNNVRILGRGPATLVLVHGFGCDQNMWRLLAPALAEEYRVVLLDLTGCGQSFAAAYQPDRYSTLHGYASDVIAIIEAFAEGPTVLVGHSVSAMIGVLVERMSPGLLTAHVMVGPSACYLNDENYQGGFSHSDIDELLATLEGNYLGWSSQMAPLIMGAPDRPELSDELTSSFCRTDPEIAAQFARVTFLSDHRDDVAHVRLPALVLQSTDDIIAPLSAGQFVASVVPGSVLSMIDNVGHCPHLSAPEACLAAIRPFLRENALGA
jgi:sigma-B regulation protein RsbQ